LKPSALQGPERLKCMLAYAGIVKAVYVPHAAEEERQERKFLPLLSALEARGCWHRPLAFDRMFKARGYSSGTSHVPKSNSKELPFGLIWPVTLTLSTEPIPCPVI
jgi:hypothetical protein